MPISAITTCSYNPPSTAALLLTLLAQSKATAVIHTASPAHNLSRAVYETVNVKGTRNVIDVCLEHDVKKLVYTSSGSVVFNGYQQLVAVDERLDFPAKALDAYNETKGTGEKMVLAANGEKLATCAIRPSGIFGEGDKQMISGFYSVVLNKQTPFQIGYNDNLADFTYVGNVAHAHLLAVDKLRTSYPCASFRDPIRSVDISSGSHRIPTSDARPLGPNTSPTEADTLAAQRFESDEHDPTDVRPVLRHRSDQFAVEASDDDPDASYPIAGEAFFITNGEPIYFWDFARSIWRGLGHTPPYIIVIPTTFGLVLASLAEMYSWLVGKEPGFTRFRVSTGAGTRYYDIEKSRRLLGYKPIVGLDEGLHRWTEWYKGELAKQKQAVESDKTK